jgi:hypothetical protein
MLVSRQIFEWNYESTNSEINANIIQYVIACMLIKSFPKFNFTHNHVLQFNLWVRMCMAFHHYFIYCVLNPEGSKKKFNP